MSEVLGTIIEKTGRAAAGSYSLKKRENSAFIFFS